MKILSKTEDGGRVVELSRDEFRELFMLAKTCDSSAIDAQSATWVLDGGFSRNDVEIKTCDYFDFATLFGNVRAFREMKYAVNKIKALGNALDDAITKSTGA